jgi:REP element-mobilizing transposase RayT
MMIRFDHYTQFVTITNLNWLPALQNKYHKQIIIEALKHRVDRKQVSIYAFVIMPNHMHFLWQLHDGIDKAAFQSDLLKFTARSILKFMMMNDDPLLQQLHIKAADRQQQVWERNSLSIDIWNEKIFIQKMNYIHNNPVQLKWKLAAIPEDYKYSSALFYETGHDEFYFLEHYKG